MLVDNRISYLMLKKSFLFKVDKIYKADLEQLQTGNSGLTI